MFSKRAGLYLSLSAAAVMVTGCEGVKSVPLAYEVEPLRSPDAVQRQLVGIGIHKDASEEQIDNIIHSITEKIIHKDREYIEAEKQFYSAEPLEKEKALDRFKKVEKDRTEYYRAIIKQQQEELKKANWSIDGQKVFLVRLQYNWEKRSYSLPDLPDFQMGSTEEAQELDKTIRANRDRNSLYEIIVNFLSGSEPDKFSCIILRKQINFVYRAYDRAFQEDFIVRHETRTYIDRPERGLPKVKEEITGFNIHACNGKLLYGFVYKPGNPSPWVLKDPAPQ